MRLPTLITCAVVIVAIPMEAQAQKHTFRSKDHGGVTLEIPEGWQHGTHGGRSDLPFTIIIKAPAGAVQLLITPLWSKANDKTFNSPEKLKVLVENAANHAKPTAVQRELPLQEIATPNARGYFFWATDKAPGNTPEDYKYVAAGAVAVGDLVLSFTILTNEEPPAGIARALDVIKNAEFTS